MSEEETFMEHVRRQKWRKKAGFKRKPLAYERKAELEQRLNRILPEPEPKPFEGEPVSSFRASWKQGREIKVLKQKSMEMRTYEVRKNPSIIFLFSLSSAKMYYDIDKDSYYLYVFSSNRNRIVRKIKIEKHDIQRLLAFALYDRYGEEIPKTLWISRRIRAQIQEITERENKHYMPSSAAHPSQKDQFSLNNFERVKIRNDPY